MVQGNGQVPNRTREDRVTELVERVRHAQPGLEAQLLRYRRQWKDYQALKSGAILGAPEAARKGARQGRTLV